MADDAERFIYVERISVEELRRALSGEGAYGSHVIGSVHDTHRVQDGWVTASHTFEIVEDGEAAILTLLLEKRGNRGGV